MSHTQDSEAREQMNLSQQFHEEDDSLQQLQHFPLHESRSTITQIDTTATLITSP